LLLVYNAAIKINPIVGLAAFILLGSMMPWLLMRSLRFKLYNSSYRGLRFGFSGDKRGAYRAFLLFPAFAAMSLYLLAPLAHQRIKQYQFNNSRFGSTAFKLHASVKGFYLIYLSALAVMVGSVLLVFALAMMLGAGGGLKGINPGLIIFIPITLVAVFLVLGSAFSAYMQNLVWGNAELGAHRFYSHVSARRLLWISVSNFIGIVLTAGLFIPFAAIRMTRFKLESMGVEVSGDLSGFVADQQLQATAAGEETAEMFDVDISF
jgi:uncharacterized membrane protein YjgN (DUF898 family)